MFDYEKNTLNYPGLGFCGFSLILLVLNLEIGKSFTNGIPYYIRHNLCN
jgi:hypothetical protein